MPIRQGCRLDEEASETLAGEQACEPRQNRPIRLLQRRSEDLASEDAHLMAQYDDLDRESVSLRPTSPMSWRTRQNAR